jgi:hypothetical protein
VNRAPLPTPPSDLTVLSQATIAACAAYRDALRRVRERICDARVSIRLAGGPYTIARWRTDGMDVTHRVDQTSLNAVLDMHEIDGDVPWRDGTRDMMSIALPLLHLDRTSHPLSPTGRIPSSESMEPLGTTGRHRRILLEAATAFLDRAILLADIACDPNRRLPQDDIPKLKARLVGLAAATFEKADPALGIVTVIAHAANADRRMTALGVGGRLHKGRRDLLPPREAERWMQGLRPTMLVGWKESDRRMSFGAPSYGWTGGEMMDTMRAIATSGVDDPHVGATKS